MKLTLSLLLLSFTFLSTSAQNKSYAQSRGDIFKVVEQMPIFSGCTTKECSDEALVEYIEKNLQYPSKARERGIEGRVFIRMIVEKDGSVSNAEIVREIGGGCGREALRVVEEMPEWNPGMHRGQAKRVIMTIPFSFKKDMIFKSIDEQSNNDLSSQKERSEVNITCGDDEISVCLEQELRNLLTPIIEKSDCLDNQSKVVKMKLVADVRQDGHIEYKSFLAPFTLKCHSQLKSATKEFVENITISDVSTIPAGKFNVNLVYNEAAAEKNGIKSQKRTSEGIDMDQLVDASEDGVFKVVDQMPLFGGCKTKECSDEKLINYVQNTLKYPRKARKNGNQGRVFVRFVIDQKGKVESAEVVRDIGGGCGQAALDVIWGMNDLTISWSPGVNFGEPVKVFYTMPFTFKLEGKSKK